MTMVENTVSDKEFAACLDAAIPVANNMTSMIGRDTPFSTATLAMALIIKAQAGQIAERTGNTPESVEAEIVSSVIVSLTALQGVTLTVTERIYQ